MSSVFRAWQWTNDPIGAAIFTGAHRSVTAKNILDPGNILGQHSPPKTPPVPNPNDAANASQQLTDQMRQRRGMLANIYAGGLAQQPVTGKTQLGS